jgi:hypothetical protein
MTMNKTAADFDGLSDALTYLRRWRKMPVSVLRKPLQWLAHFMMQNHGINGRYGERAILSRLQAPTGQAYAAIKELG